MSKYNLINCHQGRNGLTQRIVPAKAAVSSADGADCDDGSPSLSICNIYNELSDMGAVTTPHNLQPRCRHEHGGHLLSDGASLSPVVTTALLRTIVCNSLAIVMCACKYLAH